MGIATAFALPLQLRAGAAEAGGAAHQRFIQTCPGRVSAPSACRVGSAPPQGAVLGRCQSALLPGPALGQRLCPALPVTPPSSLHRSRTSKLNCLIGKINANWYFGNRSSACGDPSGHPSCPWAGPGSCLRVHTLGPQPLLLQPLVQDQGSSPPALVRPWEQLMWELLGRSSPAVPSPWCDRRRGRHWSHPSPVTVLEQGRAAASLSLLWQPQLWRQGPGLDINTLFFSKHLFQGNKVKRAHVAVPALGPGSCLAGTPSHPVPGRVPACTPIAHWAAPSAPAHPGMLARGQALA